MERIKKGDKVMVVAGKGKGHVGEVLKVFPKEERVIVSGHNLRTKHIKPSQQQPRGGRVKKEFPVHLSNVMPLDPKLGGPTRVRIVTLESGRRVRVAVKSGEQLDK